MQSIHVGHYCSVKRAVECLCDERPDVVVEPRQQPTGTASDYASPAERALAAELRRIRTAE